MTSGRGRVVPLELPTGSRNLARVLQLRADISKCHQRLTRLSKLDQQLAELAADASRTSWDALIPINLASTLVYAPGQIINPQTISIDIGGAVSGEHNGYRVDCTPQQAHGISARKQQAIRNAVDALQHALSSAESNLSDELGIAGGSLNERNELVGEDGLPFVDIQEYEDESGHVTEPPQVEPRWDIPSVQPHTVTTATSVDNIPQPTTTKKSVSFASSVKGKGSEVATSPPPVSASSTAGRPLNYPTAASSSVRSADAAKPSAAYIIRPSVVERDVTKPPPSLTAAERSTAKPSQKKSLDLSAYLPKQLRGTAISQQSLADSGDDDGGPSSDGEQVAQGDSSDSDGLYDYGSEDEDDEDDDGYHIDDVLAMREAAIEYHRKRFELGAGRGTGPLGGDRDPDAYAEPALTSADDGGFPISRHDDQADDDGRKAYSKFRHGNLQKARLVIPELLPETFASEDSSVRTSSVPEGTMSTDDEEMAYHMQGLSPSEQATFKRYMLALQNGDTLEDELSVIPAERPSEGIDAAPTAQKVGPPIVKAAAKPAAANIVVEKSSVDGAMPIPLVSDAAAGLPQKKEEVVHPKRVSRFRAAKP